MDTKRRYRGRKEDCRKRRTLRKRASVNPRKLTIGGKCDDRKRRALGTSSFRNGVDKRWNVDRREGRYGKCAIADRGELRIWFEGDNRKMPTEAKHRAPSFRIENVCPFLTKYRLNILTAIRYAIILKMGALRKVRPCSQF
jgi:hypothetical protein